MKRFSLVCPLLLPITTIVWPALSSGGRAAAKTPHKRLSRSCESCHVASSFHDIRFDHDATRFPLEGHHDGAACLLCHSVVDFSKVEAACLSCHEDVHQGRFGSDCSQCHAPSGWRAFDGSEIHSRTSFPLEGRHLLLDCQSCHEGQSPNEFSQTPARCVSCHQADYAQTTRPNHVANGFTTQCLQCHENTGWRPSTMPDHDVFFPIFSGTHRNRWDDCVICHGDVGNPKVFSCLNCHAHARTAMDPVHQSIAGYTYSSTACYGCHPTGVRGRFVDHDAFFPIFSGTHRGRWSDCAVCHIDAANRRNFSCLNCHAHARTAMDPVHQNIAGYAYSSGACFGCHPTGERGRFVDHDAQFFPIYSGVHNGKWNDCATCHTSPANRSVFTCFQCHAHDRTRMDDRHLGKVKGYSYASGACYQCHPNGRK